jgi:hypothetical protein
MGRSDMETRERCPVKRFVLEPCQGYDPICRASLEEDDDAGDFVYHADYAAMETRALAAEARIREAVEVLENDAGMPPVDAGVQPYMDWRYIQRRDALAILTREPEPAQATDPTNPATVLRALVLQEPVERTPDGLRVVSTSAETGARGDA